MSPFPVSSDALTESGFLPANRAASEDGEASKHGPTPPLRQLPVSPGWKSVGRLGAVKSGVNTICEIH